MINVFAVIRAHLAANAPLGQLVGGRIYVGPNLAQHYTPASGPAILLNTRGGSDEYSRATTRPAMQYRCYNTTAEACAELDGVLYDALQDKCSGAVRTSLRVTYPQILEEPDTEPAWLYMLSGYDHWLVVSEKDR